ncbi:MAG TPA: IS1380 family transposase [Acidimicrobiales bacterium]
MQITSTNRIVVEPGGAGVVAHVGLHALGAFADRLGLSHLLSSRITPRGERLPVHDRGKVLTQMALVIAGGGESCADVEHLRFQSDLFGHVASDSTVHRTFHELDDVALAELAKATAAARAKVWDRLALTSGTETVYLDIDASLIEVHSENKQGAAPNYKKGYGFHPMLCFADATGEALSAVLRPGNATANTIADHVAVLDGAIRQLPETIGAGHHVGEADETATRSVVVRADSAGCTTGFLAAARARQVGFFVTARSNAQVMNAVFDAVGCDVWLPATTQDGELRDGAAVAELTSLIEHSPLPAGTRLIVRREPLHPGAQRSLIPSLDFRYWGFWTDQDGDPRELDATMRAHAHVENHIQRLKDSGLTSMPFTNFAANAAWLFTVCLSGDLVRWFQLLCLSGPWKNARPKTLRWGMFHAPGRLVRRSRQLVVRVIDGWPATKVLTDSYQRMALIT